MEKLFQIQTIRKFQLKIIIQKKMFVEIEINKNKEPVSNNNKTGYS